MKGHRKYTGEKDVVGELCALRVMREDERRLQIRGSAGLITEPEGRGINQVTKGGEEYSRQKEQHVKDFRNKREWAQSKNS